MVGFSYLFASSVLLSPFKKTKQQKRKNMTEASALVCVILHLELK